jgi:GTP-binding protein EngB required for normal cell division
VTANTIGVTGLPHQGLSGRLASLTELMRLGGQRDGFSPELLAEAETLLRRSGERMRMSAAHTVVALAGGTGSGKSSLFNALSGASFSPAGVTRPTTKHTHACVWGMEGAAPLLDWLNVQRRHRYARASALDEGEASLTGLLLIDLPDHDSVVTGSAALVDRLVKLADMLIWVLDPLKYADASVHRGYLVPLAGHSAITTVVLNQADTLTPDQVEDCEGDLRRLLEAEGLHETPVLVTSAATGAGLDELRRVLADAVAARRAVTDRITADIDALMEQFAVYAGDPVPGWVPPPKVATGPKHTADRPPWELTDAPANGHADWQPWQTTTPPTLPAPTARPPWEDAAPLGHPGPEPHDLAARVPAEPAATLTAAFAKAAGVTAVTETLNGIRERTAAGYIGWPLARLRGRTPSRKAQAAEPATAPQAQRADIDNAITAFADQVGGPLPAPWSRTVREAARSRASEAQAALGSAVAQGLPARGKVTTWWRMAALAQWALVALMLAGLAWIALILAFHGGRKPPSLLGDLTLIPWLAVMVVALLLLGWLISSWCQNMVVLAADRERDQAAQAILARIAAVTRELVLTPAARELADYEHFRTELAAARAPSPPEPSRGLTA